MSPKQSALPRLQRKKNGKASAEANANKTVKPKMAAKAKAKSKAQAKAKTKKTKELKMDPGNVYSRAYHEAKRRGYNKEEVT